MSTPGPFGGGNPFEGMPIFGDLAKMFTSQGPVNWEIARQISVWVATEGQAEPNVEPADRIRLEELGRVAELHVSEVTGLSLTESGRPVTVVPANRGHWAVDTLAAYRTLLEGLASSLGQATLPPPDEVAEGDDDAAALLGNIGQLMAPVMLGMQSGFMVGHLARRSLGQYDLPIPRPTSDDLQVVAANVAEFCSDWSLPADDVRMWLCLDLMTHHAVLSRPHVRDHLQALLVDYVSGFRPDASGLEDRIASIDPANPDSWQDVLGDPAQLLGGMQTDAQRALIPRIAAITSAIEGYVDHVLDQAGGRLISSYGPLTEALRRRRVERNDGDQIVEQIFGLRLGQDEYDRGAAFVDGVVERGGDAALARLWRSARELPTPAEVDAPGLWLARIDIPDDESPPDDEA